MESKELSAGILVIWHHGSIRVDAFHRCEQQVALVILDHTGGSWLLSRVYASTEYGEWRVLWSEISKLVLRGLPSLVVGDFNCIMRSHEKRGGR